MTKPGDEVTNYVHLTAIAIYIWTAILKNIKNAS